jgi:aromatic ring-opening dioxygenase LigB subunit
VIVFGAIAPHGDPACVEGSPTQVGFDELGRRLERAAPEVTIVVTPHNVHVEGAFAVVTAATIAGRLEEQDVTLTCSVDQQLAQRILDAVRARGLPAVGMSYGSNDLSLAEMPMDWGTLIPLWFLGGEERPVVVVSPARERSLEDHIAAGAAIADACENARVALVASADHGHAHDPDGPFGYDPAAAEYDARVVDLVSRNALGDLASLEDIVGVASADSLWQMLVLHGALGGRFRADLISYERPTYFGMLCAAFEPV